MIGSRGFWIVIWYGILLLGIVGFWASLAWGRRQQWQNLDELLRSVGTMLVSTGMLLLLHRVLPSVATGSLGLALGVFVAAFIASRSLPDPLPDDADEDDETHPALRTRPSGAEPTPAEGGIPSHPPGRRSGAASVTDPGRLA